MERHERSGDPIPSRVPLRVGVAALLLVLVPLAAGPAAAQDTHHRGHAGASSGPGEVALLGINALVGGLSAGLWQELSGGTFEDGFTGGALGGSVHYAGKRLAAGSFPGAGFLGRQVAATGASIVRNVSDARAPLDSLGLAVGPLRLYLSPAEPLHPRLETDLHELYWTAHGLLDGQHAMDVGESLSSGAAVFRSDRQLYDSRDRKLRGATVGGAIFLAPLDAETERGTLAHERAHVLQLDFLYHAWFRPLEDRLARRLPRRGLVDRVDYDALFIGLQSGTHALGWPGRLTAPLEEEAGFLGNR